MTSRARASSAVAQVLNEIEVNIDSGVWPAGYRLPTERELEMRFGVARNTVRKGLKRLEFDGKIVRQVGRGSFVANQSTDLAPASRLSIQILGASPAEIMEVRLMIEPPAAQFAAQRANSTDLLQFEECLRQASQAEDLATFELWDGRLHQAVIGAARNDLLSEIYLAINSVRNQPEWINLKKRTVSPDLRAKYHAQHSELVRALRERDGENAKARMHEHLIDVRNILLG